jgi:hypothetical protein
MFQLGHFFAAIRLNLQELRLYPIFVGRGVVTLCLVLVYGSGNFSSALLYQCDHRYRLPLANIAPQLLDEFTGHPRSAKVGGEPMTATMGAKMFFQLGGFGVMDTKGDARLTDHIDYCFFRCGAANR